MPTAYDQLTHHFRTLNHLGGALAMLHWDNAAIMPDGGAAARADHIATLVSLSHSMLKKPEVGQWLAKAKVETVLDEWQKANLREMEDQYDQATLLPDDLVTQFSLATSECEMRWRQAKQDNDFAGLMPYLAKVIDLTKEKAQILAEAKKVTSYNALIDIYEPGLTTDIIDPVFDRLAAFLPDFLGQVLEQQKQKGQPKAFTGTFPIDQQKALGEQVMAWMGFDFNHGRLDVSAHPFCGGIPDDVRLTTRYRTDDFIPSLMGIIHETGHALYEQGLPKEWRDQPVGQSLGMAIHESQSLIMEMQAGRSTAFLAFLWPHAQKAFGLDQQSQDDFIKIYHQVKPGFIRVDADEVTYPLHIILRYRLEKALLSGDLQLKDLPAAWSEGMQKLLGITPPTDTLGCLQDIHWPSGGMGYFPSYTFGAMIAAQLFDAARHQVQETESGLRQGNFQPLLGWLRKNVHSQGRLKNWQELVKSATGQPFQADIFIEHLKTRYLK